MAAFSRRHFAFSGAALALGPPVLNARPAQAGGFRRTIRIGVVTPPASALGQACRAVPDAVTATPVPDHVLQIEVHANGELGSEVEIAYTVSHGASRALNGKAEIH